MVLDWHGWCTEHRSDLNGVSIQIRSYSCHLVGESSRPTRRALRARTESSSAATAMSEQRRSLATGSLLCCAPVSALCVRAVQPEGVPRARYLWAYV